MKSTWTVHGTILVRHEFAEMIEAYGEKSPLDGVEVKISAREKILGVWGTWNSWGTVRTNADGEFTISKEKDQGTRQFKIQIRFKGDRLKIYPDNDSAISDFLDTLTGWNPITRFIEESIESALENTSRMTFECDWVLGHSDKDAGIERDAGTHRINTMIFQAGARQELGDLVPRRHAQIWTLYHRVFDVLDDMEGNVGFDTGKTLAIKYPHDNPQIGDGIEAPYANPQTDTIFVVENTSGSWYSLGTLLHELGHLYMYQKSRGELGMAWQLAVHGTTHGRQEEPFVAAYEGFAEYFYFRLYKELFGGTGTAKSRKNTLSGWYLLPFSRGHLNDIGITDQNEIEHREEGWMSLFNMLTIRNLHRCDFNSPPIFAERLFTPLGSCVSPDNSFADLLRVFAPDEAAGYPRKLDKGELTKNAYLARACAILGLDSTVETLYQMLLNPQHSVQPKDELCGPLGAQKRPIGGLVGRVDNPVG